MPDSQDIPNVAVIFPAAGRGARLGGQRKQFRSLGNAPLLYRTAEAFEIHPDIHHLIFAVPPGYGKSTCEDVLSYRLTKLTAVVEGGVSRQASVARALAAIPEEVDVVLVHDAVRPFVSASLISDVIAAVGLHGAAAPAIPVVDTLRYGEKDSFGNTVPRNGLYRMQTPQGFRRAWLEAGHKQGAEDGISTTDDVELVRRLGHRIHLVPGHLHNIKVTTPEDWKLAQILWTGQHFLKL